MERNVSLKSNLNCWQKQIPEAHLTDHFQCSWYLALAPHGKSSSHPPPENSGLTTKWLLERKDFSVPLGSGLLPREQRLLLPPPSFSHLLRNKVSIYLRWQSAQVKDYFSTPSASFGSVRGTSERLFKAESAGRPHPKTCTLTLFFLLPGCNVDMNSSGLPVTLRIKAVH